MKSMRAGGTLGLQGRKLQHYFTIGKWLDNYKVMTSMNMALQQTVYKSTLYSPNILDFPKGMRAVDQKPKINLVWSN